MIILTMTLHGRKRILSIKIIAQHKLSIRPWIEDFIYSFVLNLRQHQTAIHYTLIIGSLKTYVLIIKYVQSVSLQKCDDDNVEICVLRERVGLNGIR